MKIIIDAMGGDNAPSAVIEGANKAKKLLGVDVVLVGKKEVIRQYISDNKIDEDFEIVDARENIGMDEDPTLAIREKKDSSMSVALKMLADGNGDAVVSAGSTGALLAGATLLVKRIHGIRRAAFAPVIPAGEHGVMLIDCGATAECTPEYLLQFALMGSYYAQKIMGCNNPKVGLLNIGTEPGKGDNLRMESFSLLKKAGQMGKINFIGNIEGTSVFEGVADVVVSDGFTGNVLLKTTEGAIKYMMGSVKKVFYKNAKNKLAAAVLKKDLAKMKKAFDVNEIGGTALIGISKPVIKAHGSSDAEAVFAAIRQAGVFIERNIIDDIKQNIDSMKINSMDGILE